MLPKLLTVAEFAEWCGISEWSAYALCREGKVPIVRIGRRVRIPEDRLKRWTENGGATSSEREAI